MVPKLFAGLVLALAFPVQTSPPRPSVLASDPCARIPSRPGAARSGSAVAARLRGAKGKVRDEAVVGELASGNLPPFLRQLRAVHLTGRDTDGARHEAVVFVMPDYLAVGSDEDFLRVPLGLDAAATVAQRFGFSLPTRKMVDAIYAQAELRLAPKPMQPGAQMSSTAYFVEHNRIIESQRRGQPLGILLSGHKKDLVLTRRLISRRGRVAIYGWHRLSGQPIQPLSTVHGARYADYSHGVRLVSTMIFFDGEPRSLFEVLADPKLARVLTYEGVIRDAEKLMRGRTPA